MIEFLNECVHAANLPATILMVLVLLYWLMVIVGVIGIDVLDFDLDLDIDVGVDADAPLGMGSSTSGNDGVFQALFDFFNLGEVPIVIIGSFFCFFLWIATFVTNHYFNPGHSFGIMLLWLLPNVLVCLFLTRYTMIPFAILFQKDDEKEVTREEMIGLLGLVKTSEVTESFGQIEIKPNNEPEIIINARTRPGERLRQGDAAKIVSYNNLDGTFLVELSKWENKVND